MSASIAAVANDIKTKLEATLLNSSKVLHIPQGYCGRLTMDSLFYDVDSLYTDSYSTCNIIISINRDRTKAILGHIDANVINGWNKVKSEIEWVGDDQELFIFTKERGQAIKSSLLELIRADLKIRINKREHIFDYKKTDGVLVSLKSKVDHNFHPHIKTFPPEVQPVNLFRHPQEQRFLTIQKIEQTIGMMHKAYFKHVRVKQFLIFDGRSWESLEAETNLEILSEYTRQELRFFKKTDTFVEVGGKLLGIMKHFCKNSPIPIVGPMDEHSLKQSAEDVGFFMETYLNNYEGTIEIFKRNLKDVFNNERTPTITAQDKQLQKALKQLHNDKTLFEEATTLVEKYNKEAPDSEYKKAVCSEFNLISEHYKERMRYAVLNQKRQENIMLAKKLNEEALKCYADNEYEKASAVFSKALHELNFSTVKTDAQLALLYYDYGKTLLKLDDYRNAYHFINYSLTLKQNNKITKPTKEDIEQTKAALTECLKLLKEYPGKVTKLLNFHGLSAINKSAEEYSLSDIVLGYCDIGVAKKPSSSA